MIQKPDQVIEIFLNPGDFYFGDRDTRIRTILGSCVSITMWHPRLLIGGMCHYVLPQRQRLPNEPLDGRYADEALQMFLREIKSAGTNPAEYQVKVFGGGKMFATLLEQQANANKHCNLYPCNTNSNDTCKSVSCRNVFMAKNLLEKMNLTIQSSCTGGTGHRKLFFDVWSGHVWSKLTPREQGQ